jgi:hypothetical protein
VPILGKCTQLGLLVSLVTRVHRPLCSMTTCLLDIAWLGTLAGQGVVPVAGVHASCMGAYMVKLAVVLATVTHMCYDMTGHAIMAGRLGAKTVCFPLVGIACHGLIA